MENSPEIKLKKDSESVSFKEQLDLAQKMLEYADERNRFAQNMGGGDFEGFATVGQHIGNNKTQYDTLHEKFEEFRSKFDDAVQDKSTFVKKLRSMNDDKLADAIVSMFRVNESVFQKWFGK